MSNPNQTTAPTLETLTELVQVFQQSVLARLDHIETAFGTQVLALNAFGTQLRDLNDKVEGLRLQLVGVDARQHCLETKVDGLERDLEEVRVQVVGASVRQDRIMAQIHNARADIKVLTVEVRTGDKDFVGLKQRMERL